MRTRGRAVRPIRCRERGWPCSLIHVMRARLRAGRDKKKKGGSKKKAQRRKIAPAAASFRVLLEESGFFEGTLPAPHYVSSEAAAAESGAPRAFCAVCGNFAKYRCRRCREANCGLRCYTTHNELRCLKFAL